MQLRKISTPEDVEKVKSFFCDIFWEETDYDLVHFYHSVSGAHDFERLEYYMGCVGDEVVGISGIYADNKDECWLGWFGVRPEYRRKGYASAILKLQLEMMKNDGYKVCRLYTDEVINKNAVPLYEKNGFVKDFEYENHIITMAKSLDGVTKAEKWQGEPLGFA